MTAKEMQGIRIARIYIRLCIRGIDCDLEAIGMLWLHKYAALWRTRYNRRRK